MTLNFCQIPVNTLKPLESLKTKVVDLLLKRLKFLWELTFYKITAWIQKLCT